MRPWIDLFSRFILRSMRRHKVPTVTAVLGIALGVAVMLAIRLANRSVTDSFRAAVDSVRGSASLSIVGELGRFDERRLARLDWLHEFGSPSPVVEGFAMLLDNGPASGPAESGLPPQGEMLQVLGVDVLVDRPIREFRLLRTSREDREPTAQELLALLVDADAVILTERFARRMHLDIGDRVALAFGSTRKDMTIRGLLLDQGPARSLDGNFALMDIAAAQWAFGRLGEVDRLDLRLKPGLDVQESTRQIVARLPTGLRVELPGEQFGRTETMIAAFHFNLAALSGIALLVGLFLIYNTASIAVAARREEIGVLQAVGAGPRTVLALVLGETVLVTGLGIVLGLLLARQLARGAVLATTQTVETFYIAQVARSSASSTSLDWLDVLAAVAIAMPLAIVAALAPAWKAATIQPMEVIRGVERLRRNFRPPFWHLAFSMGLGLAAWGLTRLACFGAAAGSPGMCWPRS
jgi:putative ABC transport system permease protein